MARLQSQTIPGLGLPVALIILVLCGVSVAQQEPCPVHAGDPCKCQMANNKGIDLSPLRNIPNFLNATDENYIWSPCGGVIDYPGTQCTQGAAGCQITNGAKYSIGTLGSAMFSIDRGITPFTAYLNYTSGFDARQMKITMVCMPLIDPPGTLVYKTEDPTLTYNFLLESPYVCEMTFPAVSDSLTAGSIILITFFVALFFYFAIGTIYMHAAKEAQGIEKLPHSAFWCGLPVLIKGGVMFLLSPCSGSSGKEGYEPVA